MDYEADVKKSIIKYYGNSIAVIFLGGLIWFLVLSVVNGSMLILVFGIVPLIVLTCFTAILNLIYFLPINQLVVRFLLPGIILILLLIVFIDSLSDLFYIGFFGLLNFLYGIRVYLKIKLKQKSISNNP